MHSAIELNHFTRNARAGNNNFVTEELGKAYVKKWALAIRS